MPSPDRILTLLFAVALILPPRPAAAEEVTVGVRYALPPYVVLSPAAGGLQLDLIREALKLRGHRLKVRALSSARVADEFSHDGVDAVLNASNRLFPDALFSEPLMSLRYFAIRLGNPPPSGRRYGLSQLAYQRVLAFPHARNLLGEEFGKIADANPGYREIDRLRLQVKLLYAGRVDYVLMNDRVFRHYLQELRAQANAGAGDGRVDYGRPVGYLELFAPVPCRLAFRSERLLEDFNAGLAEIRRSGAYEKIVGRYEQRSGLVDTGLRAQAADGDGDGG